MCPGNNESAGKRRRARTRKGNPTLSRALTEAGQAAGRTKSTYLGAISRRIAACRGGKKAAIAVGRHVLKIVYYVLRDGVAYEELGVNYYDERKKDAVVRCLTPKSDTRLRSAANFRARSSLLGPRVSRRLRNSTRPALLRSRGTIR